MRQPTRQTPGKGIANAGLRRSTGMQHTRNEVAALLRKSRKTRRKTDELYRQLQALMAYVERALNKPMTPRVRV